MILTAYGDFRYNFGVPATTENDGMRTFWPKQNAGKLYTMRPWTNWEFAAASGVSIDLTINGGAPSGSNDASAYVDEWHWYVSCPGAANSNARWQVTRNDPSALVSRSGRVTFSLTAHGLTLLPSQEADVMAALLRDVHIYAFQIANDIVVWIDAHRCAFAPNSFTPSWPV